MLCLSTAPLFAAADDRHQNNAPAFRKPHVPPLDLKKVDITPTMQSLLALAEEDEVFKAFLVKKPEETTQKAASTNQPHRPRKKSRTKKDPTNATLAHNASEDAPVQKITSKQSKKTSKRNKRKKALK